MLSFSFLKLAIKYSICSNSLTPVTYTSNMESGLILAMRDCWDQITRWLFSYVLCFSTDGINTLNASFLMNEEFILAYCSGRIVHNDRGIRQSARAGRCIIIDLIIYRKQSEDQLFPESRMSKLEGRISCKLLNPALSDVFHKPPLPQTALRTKYSNTLVCGTNLSLLPNPLYYIFLFFW